MSWLFDPIALWLIITRLTGWMVSTPGFTEINTPILTRVFLVVWFAIFLMPIIGPVALHINSLPELVVVLISEFAIGLGFGLTLRFIFSGIFFGGIVLDSELGYLAAQQLNPFAPQNSGVFSRLFLLIAILYFWTLDYFRVVIAALKESFNLIPLGSLNQPIFDLGLFIRLGSGMFIGGITFAAPIIAMMFFVNISLGFLARTVQGLNIFSDAFTMKILVGLIGIQLFLQLLFQFVRLQMEQIIPMSSRYFQSLLQVGG